MKRTPLLVVVLAISAGFAVQARQTLLDQMGLTRQAAPPKGTAFIVGRVVEVASGRPIAGAIVSPTVTNATAASYDPVLTDDEGRFVLRDLPGGQVNMRVTKPGYVDSAYAKRLSNDQSDPGERLSLGDGERATGITITMKKFAAIGGAVADEAGDPLVGITVRALPKRITGGRPRFSLEQIAGYTAVTDDRGMFRIGTLPPGEYVLAVPAVVTSWPKSLQRFTAAGGRQEDTLSTSRWLSGSSGGGAGGSLEVGDDAYVLTGLQRPGSLGAVPSWAGTAPNGRMLVYETEFFPGVATLSRATTITLGSGEERNGVDVRMKPVTGTRVTGSVAGPNGPVADLPLRLVHADTSAMTSDPEIGATVSDMDGRFTFLGVPPGQYAIRAARIPRAPIGTSIDIGGGVRTAGGTSGGILVIGGADALPPDEPTWWIDVPIGVGTADVAGVVATLRQGFRVAGHIEFQGAAERPPAVRVSSIAIEPADGTTSAVSAFQFGRVDPTFKFRSAGQVPGAYFVRLGYTLPGWHFKSAMAAGRDISLVPVDLSSANVDDVVITLVDHVISRLTGTVTTDKGQPDLTSSVMVFPQDRARWTNNGVTPRDLRAVGVTRGGAFALDDLPPGEYLIAAVTDASPAWASADNLTRLAPAATKLTLAEGDAKTVSLKSQATPRLMPVAASEGVGRVFHSFASCDAGPPSSEVDGGLAPFEANLWKTRPTPQQRLTRDQTPAATTGTGVISGVVMSDESTPRPMRRAAVSLSGSALQGSRLVLTDDSGRFAFTGLPAGSMGLSATKAAYLIANYGASRVGGAGTTIALAAGQALTDIKLTMVKGGVVTGTIRDERGQPLAGATVRTMRYQTSAGERRLVSVGGPFNNATDDRGVYRIYGLLPGEYLVAVSPSRFGSASARLTTQADLDAAARPAAPTGPGAATTSGTSSPSGTYAGVFYPGVTRPDDARVVRVVAGAEVASIDIAIQFVRTASVSGRVIAQGGVVPTNLNLQMTSLAESVPGVTDLFSQFPMRPRPDGSFEFTGIAPGTWALTAYSAPAGRGSADNAASASTWWATAEVRVSGVDIRDVSLTLQPGLTISGRVVVKASTLTAPALGGVRVNLAPVLTGTQVSVGQTSAQTADDGSFVIQGIMPGRYRVTATSPAFPATGATGWLLESIMAGAVDASEVGFEVKGDGSTPALSVTFSDKSAEVSGTLQTAAGRPATDFWVILFPADKALWAAGNRRIREIRPTTSGQFVFRALRAGDYLIAAVTSLEPGEYLDPAFLEQLMPGAVKLTLGEGEKKMQTLKIGGF